MDGADPALVREAIDRRDPLPGTRGFAGTIDGRPVRDVLGRYPLFVEGETIDATSPTVAVDRDPANLENPTPVPAGTVGGERVWSLPNLEPYADLDRASEAIVAALETAIQANEFGVATEMDADAETAVAFSGGVDSAVVAALVDGPLYVVGFEGGHDREAARTAAECMGRDLREVEPTHEELERAVPRIARAIGRTNAMDVAIALPLYLVAERAAADGIDVLAVGQGVDELFGGYAKVAKAPSDPRVDAETVAGARREVLETLPSQAERDVLALRAGGVEPWAPLLHDRVVEEALRLPGDSLVDDGTRKLAFRRAAREFVPPSIADRDKKAMQYGSLISRELDRLARQAGFKRRMDDHVTRYVDHRLDESIEPDESER
jgi:asparagine synthase (glutamine-hydrolysing)